MVPSMAVNILLSLGNWEGPKQSILGFFATHQHQIRTVKLELTVTYVLELIWLVVFINWTQARITL